MNKKVERAIETLLIETVTPDPVEMEQPRIDRDLFSLASFGDCAGLQRACEAEDADPSATDAYGRTLLHWRRAPAGTTASST